jgi:molecular chaperone DnaK
MGEVMTVMIARNTTIPTSKTEVFSTAADNQPAVDIKVFQGERKMARDNRLLDQFTLDGIPPAPRGYPQVEVTFSIDANGILEVKAKDKATGKEHKVSVKGSSGMSKDEVQRMVDEAKANEAADKEKAELAAARNKGEQVVHQIRGMIKEHADKFQGSEQAEIEAALVKLEKVKGETDRAAIESATAEVESLSQNWGRRIHEAAMKTQQAAAGGEAAAGPGPAPGPGPSKPEDNIKDADFTVQK